MSHISNARFLIVLYNDCFFNVMFKRKSCSHDISVTGAHNGVEANAMLNGQFSR